jgi:hypothetical protein
MAALLQANLKLEERFLLLDLVDLSQSITQKQL